MPSLITSPVEVQPGFPAVDLTEGNAHLLSVMLANRQVAADYHDAAEQSGLVFRALHPALTRSFATPGSAMSHGTMVFEAITAAVTSRSVERVGRTELTIALLDPAITGALGSRAGLLGLSEEFRADLPLTAQTIAETFPKMYTADPVYLLAGAALERAVVLKALTLRG